jgi:adenylate cyclase
LAKLLNIYFTSMTKLLFKYKGTLDKYIGDAVMAFWGAPLEVGNHALLACECAFEMLNHLDELNNTFRNNKLPTIDIGIGINSGDVNVGTMGSEIIRSYTVLGDNVNLTARLEAINKEYGTKIIISENTYHAIKDHFICREVDKVRVKGKKIPVRIYELIDKRRFDAQLKAAIDEYETAYSFYTAKDFLKAKDYFTRSSELFYGDSLSQLYIDRCNYYLEHPPSEDWDGVHQSNYK